MAGRMQTICAGVFMGMMTMDLEVDRLALSGNLSAQDAAFAREYYVRMAGSPITQPAVAVALVGMLASLLTRLYRKRHPLAVLDLALFAIGGALFALRVLPAELSLSSIPATTPTEKVAEIVQIVAAGHIGLMGLVAWSLISARIQRRARTR